MKKRRLLICILLLALAALLASACGGQLGAEEIVKQNGATVKITLDLAGGVSSGQTSRYLYIHENSPVALPWEEFGGKNIINPPARTGYRLEGFYHGTKDEEGNIIYGEKWDRSERFSEDTTLYARWVLPFVFRVLDGEGNLIKDFPVNPGDTFDTSDRAAAEVEGHTFIAYYKDKEFETPWDETFVHPGYPEGVDPDTAAPEDYVVTVYAHYVEGEYKKVYKASDFTPAANYWLIGDENGVLDFEGRTVPVLRQFTGKLVGNGVTVKNMTITRENVSDSDLGLFGRLNGASLSDVTFENCTVNVIFTRRPQGVSVVRAGFLAGVAENTSLENVTFRSCTVNIQIDKTGDNPVVPCEYEDTAEPLWANRADDEAKGNVLSHVEGTIQLNVI